MAARNPVVTGMGIVAAPGRGVDEVWSAIAAGVSGLKPLSVFQSPRYGQIPAGEIRYDLSTTGTSVRGSRTDKLGWLAARDAIADAKLDLAKAAARTGIILGGSVGGSFDSEFFLTTLIKTGRMRARPVRFHECVATVDLIAGELGLLGPGMIIATACSSSALAIATAADMIMSGEADAMLAGGADSLSKMTWGGFHSLLLVDPTGCRPFDAGRAGMSLGEGAAVLVLESEESARARGARILARLSGWGASCDAHHITAPHPEGAGAAAAMRAALARAGIEPSSIDYINAHGTGTRDNDVAESRALRTVFGEKVPPFSSTKRFFGHTLGASGAIEAVVSVEALRRQEIPPNPGFETMDPAIGLSPVSKLQKARVEHVMSNSFGFGGNNAVLIFSVPESPARPRAPQPRQIVVGSIGVIGPGVASTQDIEQPLPPGNVAVHRCEMPADSAQLNPNQRRRLGKLLQIALIAARRTYPAGPRDRTAIAIGTGRGSLEDAAAFIENYIAKDEREPMPARFPNSVHNAAAGQIAIDLGAHGMNSAPTAAEISFECALWQGISQIEAGEADAALAGSADALNKYVLAMGRRWKMWNDSAKPGEGAVVVRLAPAEKADAALARVTTARLGRCARPFNAAREADWIAAQVDLSKVDVLLSGAGGFAFLDPMYSAIAGELAARSGGRISHHTYKQFCGEFQSASAFGFSVAVDLVRQRGCSVLIFTLSAGGAKALCLVQP